VAWWNKRQMVEERSLPRESTIGPIMVAPAMVAGVGVEARQAIGISAVWSCVRCLVDASVLCQLQSFREMADGSRQRVTSGRLVDLIERPAPAMTGVALTALLMQHLSLWGECFLGKIRDGGVIIGLEALSPDRVSVEIVEGVPRYQYYSPRGQIFENLGVPDIVHVKSLSLDGVRGASPVAVCAASMNLANSLTTAASSAIDNGGVPSGVLSVPPGPGAQDQAKSLATAWQENQAGPTNRGKIAVLSGDVKFQGMSLSPADLQYVEQAKLSLADVARIFGIPPSRVNAQSQDTLTYSNIEQESLAFLTHALLPRLTLIEAALSADSDLCTQNQCVKYDVDGVLRGDSLSRAEYYTLALNPVSGWLSRAEVRDRESLPKEENPPAPATDGQQAQAPNLSQVLSLARTGRGGVNAG
jgi:HK97 family phage portal protein